MMRDAGIMGVEEVNGADVCTILHEKINNYNKHNPMADVKRLRNGVLPLESDTEELTKLTKLAEALAKLEVAEYERKVADGNLVPMDFVSTLYAQFSNELEQHFSSDSAANLLNISEHKLMAEMLERSRVRIINSIQSFILENLEQKPKPVKPSGVGVSQATRRKVKAKFGPNATKDNRGRAKSKQIKGRGKRVTRGRNTSKKT